MFALRYYSSDQNFWDKQREYATDISRSLLTQHEEILAMLNRISERHNIPHEIFYLDDRDVEAIRKVYREDFLSRSRVLKTRLDEPVNRALRSRKGHIYVTGNVGVLENGQVGWVSGSANSRARFTSSDYDYFVRSDTLLFLDALLERGVDLLNEICYPVNGDPEEQLIDRFVSSGTLKGDFKRNVSLRTKKQIDLTCETEDEIWILEAKMQLNWEAFGQAIGYTVLYSVDHPNKPLKNGIICSSGDEALQWLCQWFDVAVFNEEEKFRREQS